MRAYGIFCFVFIYFCCLFVCLFVFAFVLFYFVLLILFIVENLSRITLQRPIQIIRILLTFLVHSTFYPLHSIISLCLGSELNNLIWGSPKRVYALSVGLEICWLKNKTPLPQNGSLVMISNSIWWWDSSSGALESTPSLSLLPGPL